MLALAKRSFASERSADGNAKFILSDVRCLAITVAFDYILALGVLAHVDNGELFVSELARLLKSTGLLVIQFTDYSIPLGYILWHYKTVREIITKRRGYRINKISLNWVHSQAFRFKLSPIRMVHHSLSLPGIDKLLPDNILFKYESFCSKNRVLCRFGSDCIVLFAKNHHAHR